MQQEPWRHLDISFDKSILWYGNKLRLIDFYCQHARKTQTSNHTSTWVLYCLILQRLNWTKVQSLNISLLLRFSSIFSSANDPTTKPGHPERYLHACDKSSAAFSPRSADGSCDRGNAVYADNGWKIDFQDTPSRSLGFSRKKVWQRMFVFWDDTAELFEDVSWSLSNNRSRSWVMLSVQNSHVPLTWLGPLESQSLAHLYALT